MQGLRVVTTDCLTPVDIVKASLESTDQLCDTVVCWITGTKFLFSDHVAAVTNGRDCGVILETKNRWDWWEGNRFPAEFGRKRFNRDVVVFAHDDILFPRASGFNDYFSRWVNDKDSNCMGFQSLQSWGSFDRIRINFSGCVTWHCWAVKGDAVLGKHKQFFPDNQRNPWMCPWPTIHAKYTHGLLESYRLRRTNDSVRVWLSTPAICADYDPELTWEGWEKMFVKC